MNKTYDFEPLLFSLPERERASFAARLLSSLTPFLEDQDEGVQEALRREAEAENDPDASISLEEFQRGLEELRRK